MRSLGGSGCWAGGAVCSLWILVTSTSSVQSAFASNSSPIDAHAPFALPQLPNLHPGIPLPGGRPDVLPSLSIRELISRSSASFGNYPLLRRSRGQTGRRQADEMETSSWLAVPGFWCSG